MCVPFDSILLRVITLEGLVMTMEPVSMSGQAVETILFSCPLLSLSILQPLQSSSHLPSFLVFAAPECNVKILPHSVFIMWEARGWAKQSVFAAYLPVGNTFWDKVKIGGGLLAMLGTGKS